MSGTASFENSEVRVWDETAVCNWIKYTNNGKFEEYIPIFKEHEISGETLLSLTDEILKDEMGIKKIGKRHKLMKAINKLKAKAKQGKTFYGNNTFSISDSNNSNRRTRDTLPTIKDTGNDSENWENLNLKNNL